MQAYRKPDENVYLIIEEINRGNSAQIFGDLFQLHDRDENAIFYFSFFSPLKILIHKISPASG